MSQKLTLVCLPYAGGPTSLFVEWGRHLAPFSVDPVCLPGRGVRFGEAPAKSMVELVERLAASVSVKPPFAFFGHSMGAIVAFEFARRLRSQGLPGPLCLFASGCPAPHHFALTPRVHDLPEDQFVERLRSLNGIPDEILEHAELREILLPMLRADFQVCETYQYLPEAAVSWPIYAFGGEADAEVPLAQLDAWREQTSGEFRREIYPGGHFFLHEHWPRMISTMRIQLERLAREWHRTYDAAVG